MTYITVIKRTLLTLITVTALTPAVAQTADKPTLMVIPDNNWFFTHGYSKEVDLNGRKKTIPDYDRAFTENQEVSEAIATIAELFQQRGFEVTNIREALQSNEEEEAEDMALEADGEGEATATSALDQVLNTIKPDIKLELNWQTGTVGFGNQTCRVSLKALDSYTNTQVGLIQNTTPPMKGFFADMLKAGLQGGFEQMVNGLMRHFTDMQEKGRQIRLTFNVTQASDVNLFSEVGGARLAQKIQEWVRQNSVGGTGAEAPGTTKNRLRFQNVRIPLQAPDGQKITASEWAYKAGLEDYLKSLGVNARVDSRGLGSIIVRILGSK